MSGKLMGEILRSTLPRHQKWVLLALADGVYNGRQRVHPGVPQLAWLCDLSEKQVRRALLELEAASIIEPDEPKDKRRGGRGRATEYALHLERVPGKQCPACGGAGQHGDGCSRALWRLHRGANPPADGRDNKDETLPRTGGIAAARTLPSATQTLPSGAETLPSKDLNPPMAGGNPPAGGRPSVLASGLSDRLASVSDQRARAREAEISIEHHVDQHAQRTDSHAVALDGFAAVALPAAQARWECPECSPIGRRAILPRTFMVNAKGEGHYVRCPLIAQGRRRPGQWPTPPPGVAPEPPDTLLEPNRPRTRSTLHPEETLEPGVAEGAA